MNSAKRVSNQTLKNGSDDMKDNSSYGMSRKAMVITACVAVITFAVIAMVFWENLHPRVIFTINGDSIYLSDMMTDIYNTEATGQYLDSMYKQNYGASSSYWNAENNDGQTYGELLKDNTLELYMQREMMYREAIGAGYALTDEENTKCEESTNELYGQLTDESKRKSGLTRDKILEYYQKKTLADRYKDEWIDTFDIDDEGLIKEADISVSDYRQYDIQYYYIPYTTTGEDGSEKKMSASEKADAFKELEASYEDIAGLADFTTYIDNKTDSGDGQEDGDAEAAADEGPKAPEGTNIKYTTKSFIEKDENVFGDDLIKAVKKMDNDAITDGVVEDEDGCYIIKMVENNSMERYDSECESVITKEEEKVFSEKIDELEVDKYLIELNDSEWDRLEFGKVTIN